MRAKTMLLISLSLIWGTVLVVTSANAQANRPVVVLSPGHGWWSTDANKIDPGAVADDLVEKSLNLEVAKQTREFLSRCPVDVYLTREADDAKHTLEDVDEIVNARKPTVGVSIHTNSLGAPKSGTEAWYTVGGFDDTGSKRLGGLLTSSIATRFSIPVFGVKAETDNRHGGLYIHWWKAPSALVELGEIHSDATLLRERQRDFGRSVAEGILTYLDISAACADLAEQRGAAIAVFFPKEARSVDVSLQNDGILTWQPSEYFLVNADDAPGKQMNYPVPQAIPAGNTATWSISITAPSTPGVHRQAWRLQRSGDTVAGDVAVFVVVVPEGARDLKERLERQIAEWRQKGEQEINKLVEDLTRQLIEALKNEAEKGIRQICPAPALGGLVVTGLAWGARRRRR
jgi:N-acetylmuramoyl-L-alanine amidase